MKETDWPDEVSPEAWGRFAAYRHFADREADRASRRLGRPDLAELFLDEYLAALLRVATKYDPARGANFLFLMRLALMRAYNRCRRFAQRTCRTIQEPDHTETDFHIDRVEAQAPASYGREEIDRVLSLLTPAQCEAVRAVGLEGKSYAEAAETLGVEPATVKRAFYAAHERLKELVA